MDLTKLPPLTFEAADEMRFPCIKLARDAMRRGGGATAALNAANEIAVAAFLAKQCKFGHIAQIVGESLAALERDGMLDEPNDLVAIMALDAEARRIATYAVSSFGNRA